MPIAFAVAAAIVGVCDASHAQKTAPANVDNSARLDIRITPSSPVRLGSQLQLIVSTRQRGYLVVLAVDPTGDVKQIFPSITGDGLPYGATDQTNALKPGRPMMVPDPANVLANFELFAAATGTSAVIAVLSPIPVQLVSLTELPSASADVPTVVQNVFDMVKSLRVAPRNERAALAAPRWSMMAVSYQVE